MTTVMEHFGIRYSCWQDLGGCVNFHFIHIHASMTPIISGTPKCAGGTSGFSAPGSPQVLAFRDAVKKKFPQLGDQPGIFNCKKIEGTDIWSDHAYWNAVDLFPPNTDYGDMVYAWIKGPYEEDDVTDEDIAKIAAATASAVAVAVGGLLKPLTAFTSKINAGNIEGQQRGQEDGVSHPDEPSDALKQGGLGPWEKIGWYQGSQAQKAVAGVTEPEEGPA